MKSKCFICSLDARIPFAVIGVLLLLVSSFTSAVVMSLERNSLELPSSDVSIDSEKITFLLSNFENMVSQTINSAGMKAMDEVGNNPVIELVNPEVNTAGFGLTNAEVNRNRIVQEILEKVNLFVLASCQNESFRADDYALNVAVDKDLGVPLTDRGMIEIEEITMELNRPTIPILGPDSKKEFPVYWKASLPLSISIVKNSNQEWNEIYQTKIVVSSTINSRYPLLEALMEEFAWCIDAVENQDGISQLWSTLTLFSNVYSLARGYLHYSSSKPINVVDNAHLEVLTNAALLLQSAQVFGSVDPLAVTNFVVEGVDALKRSPSEQISEDEYVSQFNSLDSIGSLFSVFEYVSLSSDTSPESGISQQYYSELNLSEVAWGILEDCEVIELVFFNESRNLYSTLLIEESLSDEGFNSAIKQKQSQGFVLVDSHPFVTVKNDSVNSFIENFVSEMYSAGLHAELSRSNQKLEYGSHEGFPLDNGSGEWMCMDITPLIPSRVITLPVKGEIGCGSVVFGLCFDEVCFMRSHSWSNRSVDATGNVSWSSVSTTDWLCESVEIVVELDWFSKGAGSQCDVTDICYENISVDDPNLFDVVQRYRDGVFDSSFWSFVSSFGWSGSFGSDVVECQVGSWVVNEAWRQCENICVNLASLNCSVEQQDCFDPLSLWQKASMKANVCLDDAWQSLLSRQDFVGDSDEFMSVGLKSIFGVKQWFLEELEARLDVISSSVELGLSQSYDEAGRYLPSGIGRDDFSSVLNSGSLSSQLSFPFGLELSLVNESMFGWSEEIVLSVSQSPGYLSTDGSNGSSNLKLSNTCLLGPSGLPVLPPYWVVTTNCWLIEVEGVFDSFSLVDCSGESLFDPLFGMRAQQYVRTDAEVWVEVASGESVLVGYNRPLHFDVLSACFGLVPSAGAMVGDWDAASYPSESDGNLA